jgi:hypothetical protein
MHSAHSTIPTICDILKTEECCLVVALPIAIVHGRNYPDVGELAHCYMLGCWDALWRCSDRSANIPIGKLQRRAPKEVAVR